ncbi:DUF4298 domain-containing protein [Pasteurellaceae bacterium HPA106]|uniref:DUF4298 domain-containing protein n=1 Tax=Spirabiliibacterium pneumoniae TaxID=221400 RepID=UPI001AAE15E2|nr:DUF4298 domain-containing protein [Spirabiliibacterium pneumoniae]MBE2895493.1 DUF4298 domain-containing protein [Spirabiliibacterium pneumoniae]
MAKPKKSLEELCSEFAHMDERLAQAERDLKMLHAFEKQWKAAERNIKALETFYFDGDWLEDTERLESEQRYFACSGEDSIWNVSTQFYQLKIAWLKRLAKSL